MPTLQWGQLIPWYYHVLLALTQRFPVLKKGIVRALSIKKNSLSQGMVFLLSYFLPLPISHLCLHLPLPFISVFVQKTYEPLNAYVEARGWHQVASITSPVFLFYFVLFFKMVSHKAQSSATKTLLSSFPNTGIVRPYHHAWFLMWSWRSKLRPRCFPDKYFASWVVFSMAYAKVS